MNSAATTAYAHRPHTTPGYTGPFEALLDLARARRVEISSISLATITDDYIAYVQRQDPSFEDRSSFVAVATSLLLLKMWRALARDDEAPLPNDAAHVATRLAAYQVFLPAVMSVRTCWGKWPLHTRRARRIPEAAPLVPEDIHKAMQRIQSRCQRHPTRHFRSSVLPLMACRQLALNYAGTAIATRLDHLMARHDSTTAAGIMLGALGLARSGQIALQQSAHSGPLGIVRSTS